MRLEGREPLYVDDSINVILDFQILTDWYASSRTALVR